MNEITQLAVIVLGLYSCAMFFSFTTNENYELSACMTLLLMPVSMLTGLIFNLNKSPYLSEVPATVWGALAVVTAVGTGVRFWFRSRIKVAS